MPRRLTLLTARCFDILALFMYLRAYSALVFLCWTTRTYFTRVSVLEHDGTRRAGGRRDPMRESGRER